MTVVVVGGGIAGLTAAIEIKKHDEDVILIDREPMVGGRWKYYDIVKMSVPALGGEYTGIELVNKLKHDARQIGVDIRTNTYGLMFDKNKLRVLADKKISHITGDAYIMATGSIEITRGMLAIPGDRGVGVYPAGMALQVYKENGLLPGRNIVIYGPTLTGIHAAAAFSRETNVRIISPITPEMQIPGIETMEGYTITRISGKPRITSIEIVGKDKKRREIACDALLIAMGRMPKNIILKYSGAKLREEDCSVIYDEQYMSSLPGIFVTGDALKISESPEEHIELSKKVAKNVIEWVKR